MISLFSPLPAAAIRQVDKHCGGRGGGGFTTAERNLEKRGSRNGFEETNDKGRTASERAGREDANAQFVCMQRKMQRREGKGGGGSI